MYKITFQFMDIKMSINHCSLQLLNFIIKVFYRVCDIERVIMIFVIRVTVT